MAEYEEDFTRSSVCFVSFASMGEGDPHGCHFEWRKTLHDDLGISIALLRDPLYRWYQEGAAGFGSVRSTANYIRSLTRRFYVVTIGVSMGGFGALLCGLLAEVPEIVALVPQTMLGEDPRWRDNWPSVTHRPYPRIKPLLPIYGSRIRAFLAGEEDDGLDDGHAAELKGYAEIAKVPACRHSSIARTMRDDGFFRQYVR